MSMTVAQIDVCLMEARRFIACAEIARERILTEKQREGSRTAPDTYAVPLITGTRQTAAARRASLDLTRALTDLRRQA